MIRKEEMNVTGSFTLLGLSLNQFDIVAQGDLKVMSEDKRLPGQKLYGNLFAATGPNGLHWQGNLAASMVRGEVFVKDAQLVLPPEREAELVRASVVSVSFLDDTSRVILQASDESLRLQYSHPNLFIAHSSMVSAMMLVSRRRVQRRFVLYSTLKRVKNSMRFFKGACTIIEHRTCLASQVKWKSATDHIITLLKSLKQQENCSLPEMY
jgi:hypothetical protein